MFNWELFQELWESDYRKSSALLKKDYKRKNKILIMWIWLSKLCVVEIVCEDVGAWGGYAGRVRMLKACRYSSVAFPQTFYGYCWRPKYN